MQKIINFACRLFGSKKQIDKDNFQAVLFAQLACQYYAAARFAMHAQRDFVCATLFHHAVEMALKGGLARKRDLGELKKMGHRLKVTWRAFKQDYPDPNLQKHDKAVAMVDKFEVLRYPFTEGSIVVHLDWSKMPSMPTVRGGLRQPKHYPLVISDADELFAAIFRAASWNPVPFMGHNNVALDAVRLLNSQSLYLTGQSTVSP